MNREQFYEKLKAVGICEGADVSRIEDAYWFAKSAHRGQSRDNGERYFEHCRRVALNIMESEETTADEIVVAFLHDCIEDCFFPERVLQRQFGDVIAQAVHTLSKVMPTNAGEAPSASGEIQKARIEDAAYWEGIRHADIHVRRVKLADRLDNLRDMQVWTQERRQKYLAETEMYVLPIARETSAYFTQALETKVAKHVEPFVFSEKCLKCKQATVAEFTLWIKNKFFEFEDTQSKEHVSKPMADILAVRDALFAGQLGRALDVTGLKKDGGPSLEYYCGTCDRFYCDKCAIHETDSDGWSFDFYMWCPKCMPHGYRDEVLLRSLNLK